MKIKKILIYLIFAFVMILPLSVNAEVINRTEKFYLLPNNEISASTVEQVKSVFYYYLVSNNLCSSDSTMDSCFNHYNIFIEYNKNSSVFNVYFKDGHENIYIHLDDYGIYFDFKKGRTVKIKSSDFSITSTSSSVDFPYFLDDSFSSLYYYNILFNSDKVCFGDANNKCHNTGLMPSKYRELGFWKSHDLVKDDVVNYDNFDNLYVYSSIIWSNIDFKWSTNIYFNSLDNTSGSTYKSFKYNFDLDDSKSKTEITKTILVDSSLYNKYELTFESISNKSKCNKEVLGLCLDEDFYDGYTIRVYDKSITDVKYYLSSDSKSWDSVSFKSQASSEYIEYGDINWNGKYGKYVFDLSNKNDFILITISYNKKHIVFKTPELQIPEENLTEVDLTDKYAVGLIPKKLSSPVPFYYKGYYASYYSFDNFSKGYEFKLLKNEDNFTRDIIDFSNYISNNPIFYIMNLNYKKGTSSSIKYSSEYFDLIYFENEYNSVIYNDINYSPPSTNTDIESGGISDEAVNDLINGSGIDLSLTSLFSKLPDLINGLSRAFEALGDCVAIAFSSLPELVQSVLYISLIVTVILIAIKLIK